MFNSFRLLMFSRGRISVSLWCFSSSPFYAFSFILLNKNSCSYFSQIVSLCPYPNSSFTDFYAFRDYLLDNYMSDSFYLRCYHFAISCADNYEDYWYQYLYCFFTNHPSLTYYFCKELVTNF